MKEIYDVIIVGGGAAGLTAGIYTGRKKLKTLLITVDIGGQNLLTESEENYPGYTEMSGPKLMQIFEQQAIKFGTELVFGKAAKLEKINEHFEITLSNEEKYQGKVVILAYGKFPRKLGISGEDKFIGRGISTCATCLLPNSLVVTNSSVKSIENILRGQRVLSHDGTFQHVVDVTSRKYSGDLIRIKPRFFRDEEVYLTPNHPVLVAKHTNSRRESYSDNYFDTPKFVPAGNVTNKHFLLYPVIQQTGDVQSIKISEILNLPTDSKNLVFTVKETFTSHRLPDLVPIETDFMRLVGYFVSDGCITDRGINFYFNLDEYDYVADVKRIFFKLFKLKLKDDAEGNVKRVEVYSEIIRNLFQKLFGKYSYGKKVPHWFLGLPMEKQAEFIKGVWRGDGSIGAKEFVIITNSVELKEQIKSILLRLGILPNVSKRKAKNLKPSFIGKRKIIFKHDKYEIRIGGPFLEKFSKIVNKRHPKLNIRKHTCKHGWVNDKFTFLPIKKIERKPYTGSVYNLAVANTNTYVTSNCIVHNCDAPFAKNKTVAVVGGGNSALEAAELLTKFAKKVYLIHRREEFRADPITVDKVKASPIVEFILNSAVAEIKGDEKFEGIVVENVNTKEKKELKVDSMFLEIGYILDTTWVKNLLKTNKLGEIVTNKSAETSAEGIFAAGDATDSPYKQTVTAAGEGAVAALSAYNYLRAKEGKPAIKVDWS